ncbi:hypothetical protein EVAR_98100_1 [Eumeta japonica]|uniref:Uncharacterized protein n=1 Tax=Eumeta variegata TaxID=151549 RepID=A0A4C1XJE0_EUMVA|nr:hypothetical protein EVAR_98100_1 [Eumeta japonica]
MSVGGGGGGDGDNVNSSASGNITSDLESLGQPYFDNATKREYTAAVGQPAYLHCRVRNLADRANCDSNTALDLIPTHSIDCNLNPTLCFDSDPFFNFGPGLGSRLCSPFYFQF